MVSYSDIRAEKGHLSALLIQVLAIDPLRTAVAIYRYLQLTAMHDRHHLRPPKWYAILTLRYWVHFFRHTRRLLHDSTGEVFRPLSVLERFDMHSRILLLGPRSEGELMHLMSFGI